MPTRLEATRAMGVIKEYAGPAFQVQIEQLARDLNLDLSSLAETMIGRNPTHFSDEQKNKLEKLGYVIYTLHGETLEELEKRMLIDKLPLNFLHDSNEYVTPAIDGQVAILIADSVYEQTLKKPWNEQQDILADLNKQISETDSDLYVTFPPNLATFFALAHLVSPTPYTKILGNTRVGRDGKIIANYKYDQKSEKIITTIITGFLPTDYNKYTGGVLAMVVNKKVALQLKLIKPSEPEAPATPDAR